ncbi:hypothetical protein DL96DRAFT_1425079, partial [Flagelloscypha sp. PMI_526]
LSALSRTCRSLRVNALPLLYRTICVMWKHKAGAVTYTVDNRVYKALAKELVEKLEIVTIREPCLANYVRALHISLTSFAAAGVFKELARALQLLPNLEIFEVLSCLVGDSTTLTSAFSQVIIPSVRSLSLCCSAHAIFHVFPNV